MGKFNIELRNGGLGRRAPNAFHVSALMMGAVSAGTLGFDTTSSALTKPEDAEALGLTPEVDAADKVLVYHHIAEYFRNNPDGTLYIRLAAQGTSLTDMCDVANTHLFKLLEDTEGKVKQAAVVLNPDNAYVPDLTESLEADVLTAIEKAKALTAYFFNAKQQVIVGVEGRNFNGTVGAAKDLRTYLARDVFVNIGQDKLVATADALYAGYANMGTWLGVVSRASVHENIGWVQKFNLTDEANDILLEPQISSGENSMALASDFEMLNNKGYTFPRSYAGKSGVFFNDFPSLDAADSDYAYGENIRVIYKAVELAYLGLINNLNGPIDVDPDTGFITTTDAAAFEAQAIAAMDVMVQLEEVNGLDAFVDTDQDLINNPLLVKVSVVSPRTGRSITLSIGLESKLN